MGDEARWQRLAAIARKWLEDPGVGYGPGTTSRGRLTSLVMVGARVSVAEPGRVVCSLRVGAPLADAEGRWHAGAIAAAVDNVCAAVVFTAGGGPVVSVDYALSFFAAAHHDEEVEMEGRVAGRKGELTAAEVEVRRKDSGELLAVGRQWMTPLPSKTSRSSKL